MDWGKRTGILFIDLNKDFDTVNLLLLLHKVSNGRGFFLMKSSASVVHTFSLHLLTITQNAAVFKYAYTCR